MFGVDRKLATYVATSVLALALLVSAPSHSALGAGPDAVAVPTIQIALIADGTRKTLQSGAATVADLLVAQNVILRAHDVVKPAPSTHLQAGSVVRVVRIEHLTARMLRAIKPPLRSIEDGSLAFGHTRVLHAGAPGLREITTEVDRRDDGLPERHYRFTRVLRKPRPRVVAYGTKLVGYGNVRSALQMDATAYSPFCYGCSGITATGRRAGHGLVAVDPRVIPLGTKLYVPGYGPALAADIGGAIVGSRIDLGFESEGAALEYGRRQVTVYVLR